MEPDESRSRTRRWRRRSALAPLPRPGQLPGRPSSSGGARRDGEAADLLSLAFSAAMVLLTWLLLLGWRWPGVVSGHDALPGLAILQALVRAGGDWSRLALRGDVLGGANVAHSFGPTPLLSVPAALGFPATAVHDLAVFALQCGFAFFGLRAAADLAFLFSGERTLLGGPQRLAAAWLLAFAPVLGWKVGWGHLPFVAGALPLLAGLSLLAAARAGTLTVTLALATGAALCAATQYSGHQIELLSLVAGAPLFAAVLLERGRGNPRSLAAAALVTLGALLLASPGLWALVGHAASSDSPRTLSGMSLASGPSAPAVRVHWPSAPLWMLPPWAELGTRPHEVNAPVGPLAVLVCLLPWRARPRLLGGALLSLAIALVYAENVPPFAGALLRAVPLLDSFRLTPRVMLPVLLAATVLALAGSFWRGRGHSPGRPGRLAALALAVATSLLPPLPREAVAWSAALAPLVTSRVPPAGALVVLAGASVGGFRERLLPFTDGRALLADADAMGRQVRELLPALASPLERISLGFDVPPLWHNSALAGGLSSLDAYAYPSRRFLALACALQGRPYEPNLFPLVFPLGRADSRALFALYNVRWTMQPREDGRLALGEAGETAGAAWFTGPLETLGSVEALAGELLASGDALAPRLRERLLVLGGDPAAVNLPAFRDPACRAARVERVHAERPWPPWTSRVRTDGDCPLVWSVNYAETLRASVVDEAGGVAPARVFPAFGALAAVRVPAGAREVRLEVSPRRPPLGPLAPGAGLLLLGAGAALAWRSRAGGGTSPPAAGEQPGVERASGDAPARPRPGRW